MTQLELFAKAIGGGDAVLAPGLRQRVDPGAQRLLAALVRNGGDAGALAGLVAELEEQTTGTAGALRARPCRCDHPLEVLDDGFDCRCVLCGHGAKARYG